jgi:hypothetical protein
VKLTSKVLRARAPRGAGVCWAGLLVLLAGCGGGASPTEIAAGDKVRAQAVADEMVQALGTPIDRGWGPGQVAPWSGQGGRRVRQFGVSALAAGTPAAPPEAALQGSFGDAFAWPIIPIHAVLLPDGRVLSFGSTPDGQQSGLLHYALWDPAQGTDDGAMRVLDNQTGTDIFCAGQALLPRTGDVLLVGGDRLVNGQRNYANRDVNIFRRATDVLEKQQAAMSYQRWYATAVTDRRGQQIVLGGRDDRYDAGDDQRPGTENSYAPAPEVYLEGLGWRTLGSAASDMAYGATDLSWYYPHAWASPSGELLVVGHPGGLYHLNPSGGGRLTSLPGWLPINAGGILPSVMVQPGLVLTMRVDRQAFLVDDRGPTIQLQAAASPAGDRLYGSATLLADGRVLYNGGSSSGNDLAGAVNTAEIWDPASGAWASAATAAKPRLYHSVALLLPDATVLTAGGGAPGPVVNLNAEIYHPPYLYRQDGSGLPAERPVIRSAPEQMRHGGSFKLKIDKTATVSRLTLVRFGAATHSFHSDQRFMELPFTRSGTSLQVTAPASLSAAPPGFYMLFMFDGAGVPSVAKVLRLV